MSSTMYRARACVRSRTRSVEAYLEAYSVQATEELARERKLLT